MPSNFSFPHSRARVTCVENKSRLTDCQSVAPVKLLHPFFSEQTACIMLSSYGGGLVQGDRIGIDFEVESGARLFLGTQANSRVYKNDRNLPTSQQMTGRVGSGARVVFLPDPLVLHAGSHFHQQQHWQLEADANLIVGEWFQCGRSDNGECFAYQEYDSLIEIHGSGEGWLREAFNSTPASENPRQTGRFGDANLMLSLFAAGKAAQQLLEDALQELARGQREYTQVPVLGESALRPSPPDLRAYTRLDDRPVSIYRATGKTRSDFDAVWQALQAHLATPDWLGADAQLPMCRNLV